MTKLLWGRPGQRKFKTGVSNGALYPVDANGDYGEGVAWSGLTAVNESPSGAESNPQYADNGVYLNIRSAEIFGFTIEAFFYPLEFERCDGTAVVDGVRVGQQTRRPFGFSWQTLLGNDTESTDHGFEVHIAYGATANPSEKNNATVNESPEPAAFSWECTTEAVEVPGLKKSAHLVVSSLDVDEATMDQLLDILYGTAGQEPRLPLPEEVLQIAGAGAVTLVETVDPQYNAGTKVITIPDVAGVEYLVDDEVVASGAQPAITEDTEVTARATAGNRLTEDSDDRWIYRF